MLADSMKPYYYYLDFRPLPDLDDKSFGCLMRRVRGTVTVTAGLRVENGLQDPVTNPV